jgi:hypothetical protein
VHYVRKLQRRRAWSLIWDEQNECLLCCVSPLKETGDAAWDAPSITFWESKKRANGAVISWQHPQHPLHHHDNPRLAGVGCWGEDGGRLMRLPLWMRRSTTWGRDVEARQLMWGWSTLTRTRSKHGTRSKHTNSRAVVGHVHCQPYAPVSSLPLRACVPGPVLPLGEKEWAFYTSQPNLEKGEQRPTIPAWPTELGESATALCIAWCHHQ